MAGRVCLFCARDVTLTKAHIVSVSMLEKLPKDATQKLLHVESSNDGTGWSDDYRLSNVDPRERFVRILCEPCNGGWMQDIEKRAEPILLQLASGTPLTLSPEEQDSVGLWAVVATFIRGKLSRASESVLNADCEAVRRTNKIPDGYKVWLVQAERRDDLPSRHYSFSTALGRAYLSWIWLGTTIVAVASPNGSEAATLEVMRINPLVRHIHPAPSQGVDWPVFPDFPDAGVTYNEFQHIAPGMDPTQGVLSFEP